MKKLLSLLIISALLFACNDAGNNEPKPMSFAAAIVYNKYYVSPTGNDNAAGTLAAPFKTLEKGSSVLKAGDTLILRGGTYRSTKPVGTVNRFYLQNLTGTAQARVSILAYPGETVVFNMDEQLIPGTQGDGPVGLKIENCNYVHVKGIRVTGIKQNPNGSNTPAGVILYNVDNSIIELLEIDNIEGYGMYLQGGSDNNLIKNCDAHHLIDTYTGLGGANGFNITGGDASTNNTFDGCRAWWISDDGFDLFGTNSIATFRNCWAFWNGYYPGTFNQAGDGQGFKLGPAANGTTNVLRTLINCIAAENRVNGFDQNSNSDVACGYKFYNCAAVNNKKDGYFFGANTSIRQEFKNNINYGNGIWGDEIQGGPNVSNNTWNNIPAAAADFVSLSTAGIDGPRQADGSLPNINFLKLSATSYLINKGVNVGQPFNGSAPDLGPFESGGATNPPPPPPAPVYDTTFCSVVWFDRGGTATGVGRKAVKYFVKKADGLLYDDKGVKLDIVMYKQGVEWKSFLK